MIFRPELAKAIRAGNKTMTRRPVKPGHTTCRYKVGHAYAIQPGRGKASVGRLTVTEIRQETVGDISLRDARREGFRTRAEFFQYWLRLYEPQWETVEDESELEFTARLKQWNGWPRHEHTLVWVIAFVQGDLTDQPRMLTRRVGGAGGDYTTVLALSARGEQEALTEDEQARYSKQGRERDHARAVGDRKEAAATSLGDRVELIEGIRFRRRVDLSREMRVIEERVRRAERDLDKQP